MASQFLNHSKYFGVIGNILEKSAYQPNDSLNRLTIKGVGDLR